MKQEEKTLGAGRVVAGCLLGVLLAFLLPMTILTEMMALLPVVMLPSIALVALRRISGGVAAALSGAMQLVVACAYMGGAFMWMYFFMAILPVLVVLRLEKRPFAEQMKASIAAFSAGVLVSVLIFYLIYGGDVVGRMLSILSEAIRELPKASLGVVKEAFSAFDAQSMTAEEFYEAFDQMLEMLSGTYRLNLPALIFAGALISAVVCTALNARIRVHQGIAGEDEYLPLVRWALPASVTGGLLLILGISYLLDVSGVKGAESAFYAVYDIAAVAFCIQALSSIEWRMKAFRVKTFARRVVLALVAGAALMGASTYIGVYGLLSALIGTRGVIHQRRSAPNEPPKGDDSHEEK